MKTLRILYFATVREKTGVAEEALALDALGLPDGAATLGQLQAYLARRYPILAHPSIRGAVNQQFATPTTPIAAGDEIAFFPPTTGG